MCIEKLGMCETEECFELLNTTEQETKLETFLKFKKSTLGINQKPKPEPKANIMTILNLTGCVGLN